MSKTITVPKEYGYPSAAFFVNGKKYVVPTGVETVVEDVVAELIAQIESQKPKEKVYPAGYVWGIDADGKTTLRADRTNWDQNDPEAADYIKNRPFYRHLEGGDEVVFPEQKISGGMITGRQFDLQPGIVYDVYINGVCYPCLAQGSGSVFLGNPSLAGNSTLPHNNEPFCILWYGGTAPSAMFFDTIDGAVTCKVTDHRGWVYEKIDPKYLPNAADTADYQERTHWSERVEVLPEATFEIIEGLGAAILPDMAISAGDNLTVIYNDTEYDCVCTDTGSGFLAFGNYGLFADPDNPVDTGEPFVVMRTYGEDNTLIWASATLDGSVTFTLSVVAEKNHTIPERYLPRESEKYIPSIPEIFFTVDEDHLGEQFANINEDEITVLKKAVKFGKIKVIGNFYDNLGAIEVYSGPLSMSIFSTDYGFKLSGIAVPDHCTQIIVIVMEINYLGSGLWSAVYRCKSLE